MNYFVIFISFCAQCVLLATELLLSLIQLFMYMNVYTGYWAVTLNEWVTPQITLAGYSRTIFYCYCQYGAL